MLPESCALKHEDGQLFKTRFPPTLRQSLYFSGLITRASHDQLLLQLLCASRYQGFQGLDVVMVTYKKERRALYAEKFEEIS